MGLEGLRSSGKISSPKWDAPDDYDSSEETDEEDHVGMKAVLATGDDDDNEMLVEKKEKKEKTLERERFVAWVVGYLLLGVDHQRSSCIATCVEIKILRRVRAESSASSSTPSTRCLLDGVAMSNPRRSTELGRTRHCREMT